MNLKSSYVKKTFQFNFDARTSRGQMKDKTSWFVKIWDERNPAVVGIGECGPLPGLSIDARPEFETILSSTLYSINRLESTDIFSQQFIEVIPKGFPSITFGIETALLDLSNGGRRIIFDNQFINGLPIPINGLVWMGDFDFMLQQVNKKISDGYKCIKLKVGGIDFENECALLTHVRKSHPKEDVSIRLDANGAFTSANVMQRLDKLAAFDIHSIEQPLKAGLADMQGVCKRSPIPVALDEELIGLDSFEEKARILTALKPKFIVLKPSLHGGIRGCKEWIELANLNGIGWWITSALESNIGLNAICQFAANHDVTIPQGLGTGMIYMRNIPSPLTVGGGTIFNDQSRSWAVEDLV